ncbi:MAG: hypothetical protein FJ102_03140 [Deltaproteobacteria bacterium]|nr:hypothetical protein [Deltaproteobacteria bacterium]
MILLARLALAELPLPDYRQAVTEAAGAEVARVARETGAGDAEDFARRWMRAVGESARVQYEMGLAWRLAGDDARAAAAIDRAVELDPELVAARYDRGEIRLARGDVDGAAEDFSVVTRLEPRAWPGWFRTADVAGRRGDAASFETALLAAFRHGFSIRLVADDPHWRALVDDPRVGAVLRRLVTVYQGEAALDALRGR